MQRKVGHIIRIHTTDQLCILVQSASVASSSRQAKTPAAMADGLIPSGTCAENLTRTTTRVFAADAARSTNRTQDLDSDDIR